jgi:hypothetical protein
VALPAAIHRPQEFTIEFEGLAAHDHYVNFFQTSDGCRGIRLEMQHPRQLYLMLGDLAFRMLSRSFTLNEWHHLVIRGAKGIAIEARLDGKKVLHSTDALLTALDYDFDRVVVGSGYARQRPLQGAIKRFALSARDRLPPSRLYEVLRGLFAAAAAAAALWLAAALLRSLTCAGEGHGGPAPALVEDLGVLGGVAALVGAGLWLGAKDFPLSKWAILAALGLCFPAMPLAALLRRQGTGPFCRIALRCLFTSLACIPGALLALGVAQCGSHPAALAAALAAPVILMAAVRLHPVGAQGAPGGLRRPGGRPILLLALCAAVTWALLTLQDWQQVVHSLQGTPVSTAVCYALAACVTAALCRQLLGTPGADGGGNAGRARPLPWSMLLAAAPYAVFLVFALRADGLFVDGGEMHWEYFVGPIRMVRGGGWLLWDVPAQYGYLNVLLPALIPVRSAWDAFYLFQAATLAVAAGLFYRVLHHHLGVGRALSCVLVLTSFFLAYPTRLIGPAPFPSSSAVRFLGCYVLLYLAARNFLGPAPSLKGFVRQGTLVWVAALFWAAESAIYCTAIFAAPVALHLLLQCLSGGIRSLLCRETLRLIATPLAALALAVAGTAAVYLVGLGHLPDLGLYSLHGCAYARGFSALPILWSGPIWVFALTLFACACGLRSALVTRFTVEGPAGALVTAGACVWAVTSYYVGRAVPNNVVALLPLLCLALAIIMRATARGDRPSLCQVAVGAPLFCLALVAPFLNPALLDVLRGLRPYPQSISAKLREPEEGLAPLLARAGVRPDSPVVYCGFEATMPRSPDLAGCGSYENNWLPTPLQLLEEPIPATCRSRIVGRFVERHRLSGFFVQKRGQAEDRASEWLRLIARTHDAQCVFSDWDFRVIYFRYRPGLALAAAPGRPDLVGRLPAGSPDSEGGRNRPCPPGAGPLYAPP